MQRDGHGLGPGGLLPASVLKGGRNRGGRAEEAAADWLVAHGFRVLGMNVRLGALELDIVARKGGLAVIVEVRSRGPGAYQSALASVSATKRRHLLRAAERLWRETLGADATLHRFRIDVAAVTTEGRKTRVEYVRGAIVGGVVANVDHP